MALNTNNVALCLSFLYLRVVYVVAQYGQKVKIF